MLGVLLPVAAVIAALAFGAVYPWAYVPLWIGASCLGLLGLLKGARQLKLFAATALMVVMAIGVQLIPLPVEWLARLSPNTTRVLERFSLAFVGGVRAEYPLSIDAHATSITLCAAAAFLVYLIGTSALLRTHDLTRFPFALMLVAVPMGFFGIFSRQFGNGYVYGFWQSRENGVDIAGPFINRNHFAGWMLMTTLACLGWWIGQIDAARRVVPSAPGRFEWISSPNASRVVVSAVAIMAMAVALVWPMSRSAMVGFVAGLMVLAALMAWRRSLAGRSRLAIGLVLGAVVVLAVSLRGVVRLAEWFSDVPHFQGRLAAWEDAWRVFVDFPFSGTGMNTFGAAMLFYQQSNLEYHLGSAHNDYLQILSDGGLLVGLPVAVASVALAVAIRRRLHAASADAQTYWIRAGAAAALAAIAVQEVFEFTLQIGANAFLFCTMAAVALAPVRIAPTAHWLETTTAAAFNCPECGSMRLFRSRSRSRREVWRKQMTKKRLYRCHDCGWRDWCDDFGESHAPVVLPAERAGRDLTDA